MKDIDAAIKERRDTILRLQADLETLERARKLLNGAVADVPAPVVSLHSIGRRRGRQQPVHPMKGKINPRSSVGQAVAVLKEAGVALHVSEIIARIKKRGGGDVKKTSLFSTLVRMSKRGQTFYKADQPGVFGILEWQQAKTTIATNI